MYVWSLAIGPISDLTSQEIRIANLRAFGLWAFEPNVSRAFAPKILTRKYFLFLIVFKSQAFSF